ncbi:MAG: hypothetical protein IJL08_02875 [Oscillospiraceae bacterium]|nr:hypothetical protein [Oscillospiraceae bacterium]
MKTKTAILLGVFTVALVAVFAVVIPHLARASASEPGGDPGEEEKGSGVTVPVSGAETPASSGDVDYVAQYIRTNGYHEEATYPRVTIIRSVEELNDYYEANKDLYYLERWDNPASDMTIGFLNACEKYGETYFKDRILVLILLEEGSGSVRHRVTGVTWSDDKRETLTVDVDVITPECGNCDMAEWHILLEPEAGVDVADESCVTVSLHRTVQKAPSGLAYCAADGVSAALRIPEGWTYDAGMCNGETWDFFISFRPMEETEGRIVLSYMSQGVGVCGTGLKQKEVTLGGYPAWQGTYDGKKTWDFFIIKDEERPGISIWNEGLDWKKEYQQEALDILETLELGDGHLTEAQAVEIAKTAVTVKYDYTKALYNQQEGAWVVAFGRRNYAGGDQLVTVNDGGEIVDSAWGE